MIEDRDKVIDLERKLKIANDALRQIATWRRDAHDYDRENGHDLRDFDIEDIKLLEFCAMRGLDQ